MKSEYSFVHFARASRVLAITLILFSFIMTLAQSVPPGAGRYGTAKSPSAQNASSTTALLSTALVPPTSSGPVAVMASPSLFSSAVNTASASQQVTLKNTSTTDTYSIEFTNLTGSNLADFRVAPCAASTLKPGDTCDLTVTYEPFTVGSSAVTLNLTATNVTTEGNVTIAVPLKGVASTVCMQPTNWLFPLSRPQVTSATINCYYNATSNLAFGTEAQYLYNPGASANTVSGNLASLQFPGGVQLTFAGNASTGSCENVTTNSINSGTAPSTSTCGSSTGGTSTTSLQQDVQTVTQGGTFALKGLWPIVNKRGKGMQLMSVVAPKMGFDIDGISGQSTATGATDVNENLSSETYFQLDAIPANDGDDSPGSIFVDYRGGWEHVSSEFTKAAGLKSGNSFGLQQISAGLVINGFLRISAQRYFGPEQAYVNSSGSAVTVNNFKNWQLVVQLVPSNVKAKNKGTGATN
jgi:hypothetical protein